MEVEKVVQRETEFHLSSTLKFSSEEEQITVKREIIKKAGIGGMLLGRSANTTHPHAVDYFIVLSKHRNNKTNLEIKRAIIEVLAEHGL